MASAFAAPSVMAEAIVLSVLCIVVVVLRFLSRHASKTQLRWDDWLIVPALAVTLGMAAVMIATAKMGGYDTLSVSELPLARPPMNQTTPLRPPPKLATPTVQQEAAQQAALVTRMEAIFKIFQILSLAFLKPSVLFFYRRLFVTGQRSLFDLATKLLLVLTTIWSVSFLVASVAACPARLTAGLPGTTTDVATYTCAGGGPALAGPFAFIVSDALTDLVILAVPLPMIWRLQIDARRKVALSGVFLLGGLACLASVLRIVGFAQGMLAANGVSGGGFVVAGPGPGPGAGAAPPEAAIAFASPMVFWSMLESGLALIAACLPTLRFLFTGKGWRTLLGTRSSARVAEIWSSVAGRVGWTTHRSRSTWHWSFEDRSTVAGSPTPGAGSVDEKIVRDRVVSIPCPADEPVAGVEGARSEESRMEEGRVEVESAGTADATEWLETTVEASRRSQIR